MKTVKVMDSWEDDEHYRRLRPRREPTPYSGSLMVPILTPFNDENNRCLGVLCIDKVSPARFNARRDVSTAVAIGRFLIVAMMMYDQARPGWTGDRWW